MKLATFASLAVGCCLAWAVAAQQPDSGEFVQVGTHRMYVRCGGSVGARPTVILASGGGGASADWASVQSAVPAASRSCA